MWAAGPTGISWLTMHVESRSDVDDLIKKLFDKTLIADVQDINHIYQKIYAHDQHLDTDFNMRKIFFLTSDERIPEVLDVLSAFFSSRKSHYHMTSTFDLIVTPIATGNNQYVEYVKNQTMPSLDKSFTRHANLTVETYIRRAEVEQQKKMTQKMTNTHTTTTSVAAEPTIGKTSAEA